MKTLAIVSIDEKAQLKQYFSNQLIEHLIGTRRKTLVIISNLHKEIEKRYNIKCSIFFEDLREGNYSLEDITYNVSIFLSLTFTRNVISTHSEAFRYYKEIGTLLTEIRKREYDYDFIIIDCPVILTYQTVSSISVTDFTIFYMIYDDYSMTMLEDLINQLAFEEDKKQNIILQMHFIGRIQKNKLKDAISSLTKMLDNYYILRSNNLYHFETVRQQKEIEEIIQLIS